MSRRSLVALAVLAGVVCAALTASWGYRTWQTHRDHERLLAATEPYMPLARALAALPAPAGMTASKINGDVRQAIVFGFQWQGDVSPKEAATAFQSDLRQVGAVEPIGRCSSGSTAVLCRVDATLAGRAFTVFISGIPSTPTQATITPDLYVPPTGKWLTTTTF